MSLMTIQHYLTRAQQQHAGATGELTLILNDIVTSCKRVAQAVNQGALLGTMGDLGSQNVQGEVQKALDVIANTIFLESNQASGLLAGMASEEMDDPYLMPEGVHGRYLLLFDPLDGSSNVNVNISVGSIFSVLRCPEGVVQPQLADFLQPGVQQVCAGYALYGSSTMLVITTGSGVDGFTLDHGTGEFMLTHPQMRIPDDSREFAINMSNQRHWPPAIKRYVDECVQGTSGPRGVDFNMRWVASMVAEVHRILLRGGIFMYPMDNKNAAQGGRLRLLYEANPMAMLVEQAGGLASTGRQRLLELVPHALHQRVSVILGSRHEVERVQDYFSAE